MHKAALVTIAALFPSLLAVTPTFVEEAEGKEATVAPRLSEPEMVAKAVELSPLNENRKLLAQLSGTWTYNVKAWMTPEASPIEAKGIATRKPIMKGRYFVAKSNDTVLRPGENGRMKTFEFEGMSIEGYDNVKKKFVVVWCDSISDRGPDVYWHL